MNVAFFTAANGASQQQQRMNVHSNNISNVNTQGFKAERPTFASLMYGNVTGIDGQELPRGTGARMVMAETDFANGAPAQSGRLYDYAIMGDGFFGLVDPATQEISYTRKGAFSLSGFDRPNEAGDMEHVFMLSDGAGRFVLDTSGNPIEMNEETPDTLPIAVFGFDNTNGMRALGSGRFASIERNGAPRMLEGANLQQGFLESSNTDLALELTKVIESQRSYSYALKMVQTADEIENTINGLRG